MKALQTIQTIVKIARIVCKVLFVCGIVGICLCVAGIISLALGAPTFKFGGVILESLVQNEAGTSVGSMYAAMAVTAIACVCAVILTRFAIRYFDRELKDGTPFTLDGAKELMRLGILSICIPIASQILSQIVEAILTRAMADVEPPEVQIVGDVAVGVMLIILSLVCRYGAELNAQTPSEAPAENEQEA